jgi:hypothetical protein
MTTRAQRSDNAAPRPEESESPEALYERCRLLREQQRQLYRQLVQPHGSAAQQRRHAAENDRVLQHAAELFGQATQVWGRARELEIARDSRRLRTGMIVYLRSVPGEWCWGDQGDEGPDKWWTTPVRIERLGRISVEISRVDGGGFPTSRGVITRTTRQRSQLRLRPARPDLVAVQSPWADLTLIGAGLPIGGERARTVRRARRA